MTGPADVAVGPPPELRYRRRLRPFRAVREVVQAREVIRSLAERVLRARYKQTALGFAWAILSPLALMVVFTIFFERMARPDTGGAPYPLFAYLGLVPWTFFSTSLSHGGQSLINNVPLLNKVYCPREVFPISSVVVAALDATAATLAGVALFAVFTYAPRVTTAWVPVLLTIQVAFTLGCTLAMSAVIVYLRDLRHVLPIILQLGLFATPVAYGIEVIPASWLGLYATLNPLAPVIDGYRRTILLGRPPDWALLGRGAIGAAVMLVMGYLLFRKLETGIADVA